MDDLISRQAAKEAINRKYRMRKDSVIATINRLPSADARENVRGEWVNNIHDIPICNQCGYMTPYDRAIDDYEYGNFCPNCGADMRGGDAK